MMSFDSALAAVYAKPGLQAELESTTNEQMMNLGYIQMIQRTCIELIKASDQAPADQKFGVMCSRVGNAFALGSLVGMKQESGGWESADALADATGTP